jgi:hypothetical protein
MNAHLLINAVVQQTTVFLAQLATSGRLRAPLAQVANLVFVDLTNELRNQGVRKNVIADMFGMTLRTYHRKIAELSQSRSVEGRTVWEAVLEYIRQQQPVAGAKINARFAADERDVITGVLSDLASSGFCYRAGRGAQAVYRIADDKDLVGIDEGERAVANAYLVWQAVFRNGPVTQQEILDVTRLPVDSCRAAIEALLADGHIEKVPGDGDACISDRLDVPVGQAHGWEAAVFDHFQAVVNAICAKLSQGEGGSRAGELTGGATYTFDLWSGHPLEDELLGTLARVRGELKPQGRTNCQNRQAGEHLCRWQERLGPLSPRFSRRDQLQVRPPRAPTNYREAHLGAWSTQRMERCLTPNPPTSQAGHKRPVQSSNGNPS